MAEQLSKKLNEKLSEQDKKTLESLFNFTDLLEELYTKATYTIEQRDAIVNKELNITYLLEQIVKIKNKHISNEEKKNQIHALLTFAPIDYIVNEVKEEISKVEALMVERIKESAKVLQDKCGVMKTNFDMVIESNIKTEEEKIKKAEEEKKEAGEKIKETDKKEKETQLIEYKENGFLAKFKKQREQEGKGIFKSFWGALKETFKEGIDAYSFEKSQKEETKNEEKQKFQKEIDLLEAQINEEEQRIEVIEEQIKTFKENIKKLKEQKKELKEQLTQAAEKVLEDAKEKLTKSTAPIPEEEITEERVGSVFEKIQAFRENTLSKKINKLGEQVKEIKSDIQNRIVTMSEQTPKGQFYMDREKEKDMAYDLSLLKRKEAKKEKLEKKLDKISKRNEGQDR